MGVQFTIPDKLHSEHKRDDAVTVYSLAKMAEVDRVVHMYRSCGGY